MSTILLSILLFVFVVFTAYTFIDLVSSGTESMTLRLIIIMIMAVILLSVTFNMDLLTTLFLTFIAGLLIIYYRKYLKLKETLKFEAQLVNALLMINSALKAGRNLEQAFNLVVKGMPAPVSDEFGIVLQELRLGVTLEEALQNMTSRVHSKDLKLCVTAILFQKDTGGNLSELFSQIIFTIGERTKLKGMLRTMTAQGRMSGIIVSFLPFFLLFVLYILNPAHAHLLLTDPLGIKLFFVGLFLQITGLWMIFKIVSFDI